MVVLGQYNSVMLSIKLYWVSKVLVCLYILEKVEISTGVPIPNTQTTEYRATQLVSSIRFKAESRNFGPGVIMKNLCVCL